MDLYSDLCRRFSGYLKVALVKKRSDCSRFNKLLSVESGGIFRSVDQSKFTTNNCQVLVFKLRESGLFSGFRAERLTFIRKKNAFKGRTTQVEGFLWLVEKPGVGD